MSYEKVQINWKPIKLDYFLQKNYSYSLWHFSLSLAGNLLWWKDFRGYKKTESGLLKISWKDFWRKRIKELESLKKKNLYTLDNFLQKTRPYLDNWEIPRALLEKKISPRNRNYIEEIFELNSFFGQIDFLIKRMNGFLNIQNLRGTPLKRTNTIILTWSAFIHDNEGRTQIINIINLLKWFSEKFKDMSLYKSFYEEINEIHAEKVTKLIYRYRKELSPKYLVGVVENGKTKFKENVRNKLISFEAKQVKIKTIRESDWDKCNSHTPLVTFPNGEKYTLFDFEENWKKSH